AEWFCCGEVIGMMGGKLVMGDVTITGLDAAPVWTVAPPPWTRESLRAGLAAIDVVWRIAAEEEGLAAAGCARMPAVPSRVLAAGAPPLAPLLRPSPGWPLAYAPPP